jgi:Protein of unknown function (DUF2800)
MGRDAFKGAAMNASFEPAHSPFGVVFPTIAGAFGTCDLIVRLGNTVYVIDFKFGSGVRVLALYPDGDEDVINGQLLFYAAAARHSLLAFFAGVDTIVLTILQPQSIEPDAEMVSAAAVAHAELDAFIALYRAACEEALTPAPRLERGAHCRFCLARPICPAHTGPLLDLAQLAVPTPLPATLVVERALNISRFHSGMKPALVYAAPSVKQAYLQVLADGLNLVDAVKEISKALHDQAKQALDAGDAVPGYAVSAGRAVRSWKNETTAAPDLLKLGLRRDDVLIETLRTPKQIEIRAKAGVSLVRAENARAPVAGRSELVRSFTAALESFQGGKQA